MIDYDPRRVCDCTTACACKAWTKDPDGTVRHWGYRVEPPGPTYQRVLGNKRRMSELEPWPQQRLRDSLDGAEGQTTWMGKRTAVRWSGVRKTDGLSPFGRPMRAGETYDLYHVTLGDRTDWVVEVTDEEVRTMVRDEHMGMPCAVPGGLVFFIEAWIQRFDPRHELSFERWRQLDGLEVPVSES